MAQQAFDHWFNTLADPKYADRCRRKKKLRQRKSRMDNYQIDEDVWARHPTNGVMYIASVTAVNSPQDTCRVTFVDDGRTFTLPLNHLRHVTHDDIQCNRYVDYEHGWTERTMLGTVITYDRYGEAQQVQYTDIPEDIFNSFITTEESNCIDNDTVDTTTASSSASGEEEDIPETEPTWVRVLDPEDPTATYRTCPIWNASCDAEAEKQALELCYQDIHYREAVQRAQCLMERSQQLDSSHPKENSCSDNDTADATPATDSIINEEVYSDRSTNEPIWVRVPDPEEPTATYSNCPIWNAASYAEAEKKAFDLCNQDTHYREAVQRAQHRIEAPQQFISLHLEGLDSSQRHEPFAQTEIRLIPRSPSPLNKSSMSMEKSFLDFVEHPLFSDDIEESQQPSPSIHEENNTQSTENLAHTNSQAFEICPPLKEYDVSDDKSSQQLVDQQLFFNSIQKNEHQSSIATPVSNYLPSGKEVGTQTESFTSLSMVPIEQTYKPIVMVNPSRPIKYHSTSTINTKKRTNSSSPKHHHRRLQCLPSTIIAGIDKQHQFWPRFRFCNSYTYTFTKLLPFILLAIMISYQLLIGSTMAYKDVNSMTITKTDMISTDIIHPNAISMLPLFSILNGPSQSMFELWPYPCTVP